MRLGWGFDKKSTQECQDFQYCQDSHKGHVIIIKKATSIEVSEVMKNESVMKDVKVTKDFKTHNIHANFEYCAGITSISLLCFENQ